MTLFKRLLNNNRFIGVAVAAVVLIAPEVASAATAYVSAAVNIRSGPGANYARLAALPAGAAVNAGSCRNGWCQIYNGNSVGFVSARYLRFGSYQGQAYSAPSSTTVIVDNGYSDGWAPGFGLGLGLGWATGGYWDPGWGYGWGVGPAWRTGPAYHYGWAAPVSPPHFNGGGFSQPAFNTPAFRRPAFNTPAFRRPAFNTPAFSRPAFNTPAFSRPAFNTPAFSRPAFNPGFGGGHFGNMRPIHSGR